MVKILFIIGILTSGCALNQPTFNVKTKQLTCNDNNNNQITVIMYTKSKNIKEFAKASFNRNLKRREIKLSANLIDNNPVSILEFVAYHECGHHHNNDVDVSNVPKKRFLWSNEIIQEEADADCFAANIYYDSNGETAFESLIIDLKQSSLITERRIKRIENCVVTFLYK